MGETKSLAGPAAALVAVQVVHASIPGPGEGGSVLGPAVGLVFLVLSVISVFGARAAKPWTPALLRWTGIGVAAGFLAYHAVPVKTPLSYPYWGNTTANVGQWLPVIAAIAVGSWCAWLARRSRFEFDGPAFYADAAKNGPS